MNLSILKMNLDNKIAIPLVIEETVKVVYSRGMRASKNKADFHISYLGG